MDETLNRNEIIYKQLAELIRNEVIHGDVDKIPGIRDLASRYSVNFKTVNKAINQLIDEGYLYRIKGKGTFVLKKSVILNNRIKVGFLLPNILNPYFAYLAHITETIGFENSFAVQVATAGINSKRTNVVMEEFYNQKIDIILLHGGVLKAGANFQQISRYGIPVVGMHTELTTIDNVRPDVEKAAFIVTEFLINTYDEKVGYICGSSDDLANTSRFKGYARALNSNGFEVNNNLLIKTTPTFRGGYLAVNQLLKKKETPRALVCYNEIMAMGVVSGLLEKGLSVPDQIAVAGMDDAIAVDEMVRPIPTVSLANQEMARTALELCKRRLTIPDALPVFKQIDPYLIIR